MKAVTWQGRRDVRVEDVPDPGSRSRPTRSSASRRPGSAGRTCTSTRSSAPFLDAGDVLGHEPMGIVEEVGADVTDVKAGDRVVVPFNISCGDCFMCDAGPAVAVRDHPGPRARHRRGAVRLHQALRPGAGRPGGVPAGAAGALRPDHGAGGAARRPLRLPVGRAADRVAGGASTPMCPAGGSWSCSASAPSATWRRAIALHRGAEQRDRHRPGARAAGARAGARRATCSTSRSTDDVGDAVRELTGGRGPDAVIDAVGMEAHGAPSASSRTGWRRCCRTPSRAR